MDLFVKDGMHDEMNPVQKGHATDSLVKGRTMESSVEGAHEGMNPL